MADDKWLEQFDEESGRLFYYNVTSGRRQWHKPPVQPWHLKDGRFVPAPVPAIFPTDLAGEAAAAEADAQRLHLSAVRALAALENADRRAAGLGPVTARGVDVGAPQWKAGATALAAVAAQRGLSRGSTSRPPTPGSVTVHSASQGGGSRKDLATEAASRRSVK